MDITQNITRMSEPEVINRMNDVIGIPQMIFLMVSALIIFLIVGNSIVKKNKAKMNFIIAISFLLIVGVFIFLALNPNFTYDLWNLLN